MLEQLLFEGSVHLEFRGDNKGKEVAGGHRKCGEAGWCRVSSHTKTDKRQAHVKKAPSCPMEKLHLLPVTFLTLPWSLKVSTDPPSNVQ